MPELPEVETIANDLKKVLPGLKIQDFWTDLKNLPKNIKKEVVGRKILKLERRGKNILIHLDKNLIFLVHQKMTGHLLYGKWQKKNNEWQSVVSGPLRDPENRFIHLIFFLSNGKQLALCDMRKFARVAVLPVEKITEEFKKIGIDALDKNLTLKKFTEIIENKKGKIKTVLMNQNIIAGIGNIYSDEILWLSGVHPLKETSKLSKQKFKKIYSSIRPVLKRAIKARGSSYIDYRDALGRKGRYQKMHYAYQQTGKKCRKKDGGIIRKIKIGGRSAHFCPIHQKL